MSVSEYVDVERRRETTCADAAGQADAMAASEIVSPMTRTQPTLPQAPVSCQPGLAGR